MFERFFIIVVGLMFIATSMGGLFFPAYFTSMVDVSLEHISSHSEIRSNYGGMHLMLGSFILWCGIKQKNTNFALLLTLLFTGGYVLGRSISFVVDGSPNTFVFLVTGGEIFAALSALYLLQKRRLLNNTGV